MNRDAYRENTSVPKPSPLQEETTENRSWLVPLVESLSPPGQPGGPAELPPPVVTVKLHEPSRLGLRVRSVPAPPWSARSGGRRGRELPSCQCVEPPTSGFTSVTPMPGPALVQTFGSALGGRWGSSSFSIFSSASKASLCPLLPFIQMC